MSESDKHESELARLLQQPVYDDSLSEQHRESLHERALQAFKQATQQQQAMPVHSNSSPLYKWREMMRRPLPRLIAATIICLSIAAPWLFFPAHQTKVSAFEKLASAIVDAKTAKFQMEMKLKGEKIGVAQAALPPMKSLSYYRAPGKSRTEMSAPGKKQHIAIHDDETGRSLGLEPDQKMAYLFIPKGQPANRRPNNPFAQVKELLTKKDDKENSIQDLGEKEIDGRRAVGFRTKAVWGESTIWGDPATQLPIRIETTTYGTPQVDLVMSNFEVNIELDEALFDMTPPAGYQVQTREVDAAEPSEKDFIDALKRCAAISGGHFPDGFSNFETSAFFNKHNKARLKELGFNPDDKKPNPEAIKKLSDEQLPIIRGCSFVLGMKESADASYAGKGVQHGTKDKPIFWYRPKDSTKYRVIYADLTVKDTDTAPVDPSAVQLIPKTDSPKP